MYKAFLRAKSACDKWHDYEMDVAPYENGKPIYYDFTACPVAEFAKLGFSPGTTFAACVRRIE